MRLKYLVMVFAILALSLTALACGDDDDDDNGGDNGGQQTEAPAENGDDGDDSEGDDDDGDDGGNGGGGGFGDGTGTLTIGDETWEITGVGCVFSAEEAQHPDFPFNLSGFTETSTGARAQVSADIYDPSGQERTEGEGVSHNISINDVEDFENPSASWSTIPGGFQGSEDTQLTIDGKNIHGEGYFDDGTTDLEIEAVPGTLEVQCP